MRSILNQMHLAVIKSQAWVAVCFTMLCLYLQLINQNYNEQLLWISFFATLLAYNWAYWYPKQSYHWRIIVIIISSIACMYLGIQGLNLNSWILLVTLGIISILYTIPIKAHTLRQIPGIKIFLIALVWSGTQLLPWLESTTIDIWRISWQTITIFLFVLAITIPFDIRDMKLDPQQLNTIPQIIGVERSIRLSTQLLMLSMGTFLIAMNFELSAATIAYLLSTLFAIALVRRTHHEKSEWFIEFWMEGLSALPLIIYYIMTTFK